MQETESNILDTLKLDKALRLAKQKSEEGSLGEARTIYQDILIRFPKNKKAIEGIKALLGKTKAISKTSEIQGPSQDSLQPLINLYEQGQHEKALCHVTSLLRNFPNSVILYNICGAAYQGLGQIDNAIYSFKKAISIDPFYADAYSNMGIAMQNQGKLNEAVEAYKKALSIKPDHFDIYC